MFSMNLFRFLYESFLAISLLQSPIGNTAHEAVLKLRSLVAGTYHFTLNVTDGKGASSTDTVVVTVKKGRL